MTSGGGQGDDPYELDPFGEGEYEPRMGFGLASVAEKKAAEHLAHARLFVRSEMVAHVDRSNQLSLSARKSATVRLADLEDLYQEIAESNSRAQSCGAESPELQEAVSNAIDRASELKGAYDALIAVAAKMATADPVLASTLPLPINPATLMEPHAASAKVHDDLRDWYAAAPKGDGKLVVVKATPGVGKTHAMLRLAYAAQQAGERALVACRTKGMIAGPDAEITKRLTYLHPTGKTGLSVIHGRDETNCMKHETVEAVMAHGYAPGRAVCFQCEYYPDNSRIYGLGICGYYQERINAFNIARGARRGWHRLYNIIVTTQASYIAANLVEGGRWGAFWPADVACVDEDPTDAMEVDIIVGQSQCRFVSRSPATQAAGAFAALCSTAIELARLDRKAAAKDKFKADDSDERNTHPVHSKYDSQYTGDALHRLLEDARRRQRGSAASLGQMLREVAYGGGFHVQVGGLAAVSSTDDINQLDVPPKSLERLADAVLEEINHSLVLRRQLYHELTGTYPTGVADVMEELEKHTEVSPLSYVSRLECLPKDPEKGRDEDEWRFVLRDHRPLANTSTTLVVGDAYAQKEHYEYLFQRSADMIEVTASLHPEAQIIRIQDDGCNISEMQRGGVERVMGIIEANLIQFAKPGDRLLLYGHDKLRHKVEPWLEGIAERFQLGDWAYEHWWGGRGKDGYNGWELTFTISDPILSLSGIKHVANARAFRDSVRAKTPDEKLLHAKRCEVASSKRGTIHALRNSHPRIALEHDRMNVAELTQAAHRARLAHNPVRTICIGESEQSPDTIAQVHNVVLADSRKAKASTTRRSKTRQITATVDSFLSEEEAYQAVLGIIKHFGFYTPWLAHALVSVPAEVCGPTLFSDLAAESAEVFRLRGVGSAHPNGVRVVPSGKGPKDALASVQTRVGSVNYRSIYLDDGPNPPDLASFPQDPHGGGAKVPGAATAMGSAGPGGSTEPAGGPTEPAEGITGPSGLVLPPEGSFVRLEPDLRSIIERAWHPPAYWQLLNEKRSLPKAVREVHLRLSRLVPFVEPKRWPTWAKGMCGRKPRVYYLDSVLPLPGPLRLFYAMFDNQYGPLQTLPDGTRRLKRPNAVMAIPQSISEIPF